jgi:hypothetical protein
MIEIRIINFKRRTTMTSLALQAYHNHLREVFGPKADEKARETGFVQRQSPLSGSLFVQALVWTVYQLGSITLSAVAAMAEELDPRCRVSAQAIDERMTKAAVSFLQAMLLWVVQQTIPQPTLVVPLLSLFSAVYLLDSTVISLPSALRSEFAGCGGDGSSAAAKCYLLLEWLTGRWEAVEWRDGKKADQNMGSLFVRGRPRGALWLMDLGFWNLGFLFLIEQAESFFLSRLYSQTVVSVRDSWGQLQRLELDRLLGRAPRERVFELAVYLGATQLLPARLVCVPLPPEVGNQRRRRARETARRQGRTPTQQLLRRLDWNLFVTNAPPRRLPTTTVAVVYRVRWQVELAFRLAKSEAGLERTNSEKPTRVLCELYAKMIALLLFSRLLALLDGYQYRRHSERAAWQRLRQKLLPWGRRLRQGRGLSSLRALLEFIERRARRSKRRRYPTTQQRLEAATQSASDFQLLQPLELIQLRRKDRHASVSHLFLAAAVPLPAAA